MMELGARRGYSAIGAGAAAPAGAPAPRPARPARPWRRAVVGAFASSLNRPPQKTTKTTMAKLQLKTYDLDKSHQPDYQTHQSTTTSYNGDSTESRCKQSTKQQYRQHLQPALRLASKNLL